MVNIPKERKGKEKRGKERKGDTAMWTETGEVKEKKKKKNKVMYHFFSQFLTWLDRTFWVAQDNAGQDKTKSPLPSRVQSSWVESRHSLGLGFSSHVRMANGNVNVNWEWLYIHIYMYDYDYDLWLMMHVYVYVCIQSLELNWIMNDPTWQ